LPTGLSWRGEVQRGEPGGGAGALGRTRLRGRGGSQAGGSVEPFGGGAGGSGLGGMLLSVAQAGDGFGERGELGDEHDRGECPIETNLLKSIAWLVAIFAVFVPLAIRAYRRAS
jgi:hypothetical protein